MDYNFKNAHNFSGGPGVLPQEVLRDLSQAVLDLPGRGASILGVNHREPWFEQIINATKEAITELLRLPDDYEIIFLQGGSSLQFSMIPMNLGAGLGKREITGAYLESGYWSQKAVLEASKICKTVILWSGKEEGFIRLPTQEELDKRELLGVANYMHYVSNETAEGLEFAYVPQAGTQRLVCDMSSDFMTKPIANIEKFDLIYAHGQKNLGPAGVTIILLKKDILTDIPDGLPEMLDYRSHVNANSLYNTPPVFGIYTLYLSLKWIQETFQGLEALAEFRQKRADMLRQALLFSRSEFRLRTLSDHSNSNICFHCPSESTMTSFLEGAAHLGFQGLKGHRKTGGARVSLYNGMTLGATSHLAEFIQTYE